MPASETPIRRAAFIGLGVMGEPMCRNLTIKRQNIGLEDVRAFDLRPDPLQRLADAGAVAAASAAGNPRTRTANSFPSPNRGQ